MRGWPKCAQSTIGRRVSASDEFLVQLTSGTTGRPKAASLSHLAVLNCARFFADAICYGEGETFLNPLPVYHVGGMVSGILTTLVRAGSFVTVSRFTPRGALDAIRQMRPALIGMVPTMLIDLLAEPDVTEADFRGVRTIIGGATNVDPGLIDDVERRLGVRFVVAYGQSEAPCMTSASPDDSLAVRTRSLGRPLPGRDYRIVGAKGARVPVGTVGELCVRGPLVMSGYRRSDGSMDQATDDGGWLPTGDLCVMDAVGVLTFRGRLREVIIRGGANVYPAEVEAVLSGCDEVAEVAVFGVPDERLGERVVAAVIPRRAVDVCIEQVRSYAKSRLGGQKCPADWIVLDDFPRTSTGKVRKHLLAQRYLAERGVSR